MNQEALSKNLVHLRRQLKALIEENKQLTDPRVVAISQEMDVIIVEMQKDLIYTEKFDHYASQKTG